jgi:hypothetical protein
VGDCPGHPADRAHNPWVVGSSPSRPTVNFSASPDPWPVVGELQCQQPGWRLRRLVVEVARREVAPPAEWVEGVSSAGSGVLDHARSN